MPIPIAVFLKMRKMVLLRTKMTGDTRFWRLLVIINGIGLIFGCFVKLTRGNHENAQNLKINAILLIA